MAQTPEQLRQELSKLLQQIDNISKEAADKIVAAFTDMDEIKKEIKRLNKELDETMFISDSIFRTFQEINAELRNQNLLLKVGKSAYKTLTDISQDLLMYQQGNLDLTFKQFKKIEDRISTEKIELGFLKQRLEDQESHNNKLIEFYKKQLDNDVKLSASQKRKLKEAQEELVLLDNIQHTLDQGIITLEKEYDLSRKINVARRDLGGIALTSGKLISQYFGSLASFIHLDEATDKVEEFTEKTITGAIHKIRGKLYKLEKEKRVIEFHLEAGNITGLENIENAQKRILQLEEEQYALKEAAIKSTNNLGNKFKTLSLFVGEIGKGLLKGLKDPVVLITYFIAKGLEANRQAVELGKALGFGTDRANEFREYIADVSRNTANINVTTQNIVEAYSQLSSITGFVYNFTSDQLETQIKLTKQVGLQAEEAAQIQRFAILNNVTSNKTYESFVRGLTVARNQLRVGIDFKATLAEAVKVSGQLAATLGYAPERIAKAVVQAKALGISLAEARDIANALLEFQSSIENELKAELLLGRSLNLERARALALQGNYMGVAEEITKQGITAENFARMNVLQQQSLAAAFGMQVDQLAEQLRKRKEAIASGKSLAQITKEEAQQALERQNIQDKFNAAILKLQDFIGNLLAGPVGNLLDALVDILGVVNKLLTGLSPIFKGISQVAMWLSKILSNSVVLGVVLGGIGIAAIPRIAKGFSSILPIIGNMGKKLLSIFNPKTYSDFFNNIKEIFTNKNTKNPLNTNIPQQTVSPSIPQSPQQTAKGGGLNTFMKSLNPMGMIKGAAAIAILSGAVFIFSKALQELAKVDHESILKGIVSLSALTLAAIGISTIKTSIISGAIALSLLGASLIPTTFALKMFSEVKWEDIAKAGVALIGLGTAGALFGSFAPLLLMGSLAIGALGISLIPFALALNLAAPAAEKFTNSLKQLVELDMGKLMLLGPALISVGAGLTMFSTSLAAGGLLSKVFGGSALNSIKELSELSNPLQNVSISLSNIATSLNSVSESLNKIDTSKLEALEGFAKTNAIISAVKGITSAIISPIQTINNIIDKEDKEIKSEDITLNNTIDLSPMITAIKEVKNAVDNIKNQQIVVNLDGRKVGTGTYMASSKLA